MNNTVRKTLLMALLATMLLASSLTFIRAYASTPPNWDVSGTWVFENTSTQYPSGSPYPKTMTLSQDTNGVITGSGYNLDDSGHQWTVQGQVESNDISFELTYSTSPLVGYVATFSGTIDAYGEMAGTWSDEWFQDTGDWWTTDGQARPLVIVEVDDQDAIVTIVPFDDPPEENIGPTWMITVENLDLCVKPTVRLLIPELEEGETANDLYIVQFVLLGDFNDDGVIDGWDIRLIAHAVKERYYCWSLDLNGDEKVTPLDIHVANSNREQDPQWIPLTTTVDGQYLVAHPRHFSGWGIRR